jgi:adenosine deaminase
VNTLGVTRIGHGIRASEDEYILRELVSRNVGFEVCLSSNEQLRACASLESHPLIKLIRAGCRVSLCTDDPAFFDTNSANEYRLAQTLGISHAEIQKINLDSVEMAFCDERTKEILRTLIATDL